MVPGERIELPTNGLQNRCSTAELTRRRYNRAFPTARVEQYPTAATGLLPVRPVSV
jgi:hypothetical protein